MLRLVYSMDFSKVLNMVVVAVSLYLLILQKRYDHNSSSSRGYFKNIMFVTFIS